MPGPDQPPCQHPQQYRLRNDTDREAERCGACDQLLQDGSEAVRGRLADLSRRMHVLRPEHQHTGGLERFDLTRVGVPVDQPGPPPTWPAGALVATDGVAMWVVDHDPAVDKLPPGTCNRLDAR